MNDNIRAVLERPEFARLKDWADIGPVQKAMLEDFVDVLVLQIHAEGYDEGWNDAREVYVYIPPELDRW
jgi:hypothetical protein